MVNGRLKRLHLHYRNDKIRKKRWKSFLRSFQFCLTMLYMCTCLHCKCTDILTKHFMIHCWVKKVTTQQNVSDHRTGFCWPSLVPPCALLKIRPCIPTRFCQIICLCVCVCVCLRACARLCVLHSSTGTKTNFTGQSQWQDHSGTFGQDIFCQGTTPKEDLHSLRNKFHLCRWRLCWAGRTDRTTGNHRRHLLQVKR